MLFIKVAVFDEMKPKISSTDEIHDQIQVFSILEGIESVDKKLILEAFQKIELIHDRFDALFEQNSG